MEKEKRDQTCKLWHGDSDEFDEEKITGDFFIRGKFICTKNVLKWKNMGHKFMRTKSVFKWKKYGSFLTKT